MVQSPTEGHVLRLRLRIHVRRVGGGQRCELKVKSCLEEEVLCRLPMDHLFSVVFLLGKVTPHISPLASVRCRGCRWSVLSPEDCAVRGCSWSLLYDLES